MPPPGPTSPHEYSKPELQYGLLLPPSSAGESVGDAVGLAVAPVGPGLGVTGSGDGAGLVEAADDDAEALASSCTAPNEPAVVDEHPAIAAVTSANPTVSSFRRVPTDVLRSVTMRMRIIPISLRRIISRQGSRKSEQFQFVT